MTAIAKKEIDSRALELKRQGFVANTEADCIALMVGESKRVKLLDLESLQRLKTRFSRLKDNIGIDLRTELIGNYVTITRHEDEVVR